MALPDSITGLTNWWRGDDLGSNGASISSWPAVATTGGGVALAQATGGSQPTVVASTAALGGAKSALFDGVDDYFAATISGVSQPFTVAAVVNVLADVRELLTSSTWGGGFGSGSTAGRISQNAGTADLNSDQAYVAAGIVMLVANGASSADYEGTSTLHSTSGTNPGTNGLAAAINVGRNINTSALYLSGHLAELCIYNVALGSTDRETLRAYLQAKYFPTGGGAGSLVAVRDRGMTRGLNRGLVAA